MGAPAPLSSSPDPGPWSARQGPRGIEILEAGGTVIFTILGNLARDAENPNLRLVVDAPGLLAERTKALEGGERTALAFEVYCRVVSAPRIESTSSDRYVTLTELAAHAFVAADAFLAYQETDARCLAEMERRTLHGSGTGTPIGLMSSVAEGAGVRESVRTELKGPPA